METAIPALSTMETWLVEGSSGVASLPRASASGGVPGWAIPMERVPISLPRSAR
ncbi:hypothetical protein D3C84_1108070 [compost metagenome]